MHSCVYVGTVRHRRFAPVTHAFRYRICLLLLDVDRVASVFSGNWLWSASRFAPGWFRRADFFGDPARPLSECIRDLVQRETSLRPAGPVMLLANPRYFGVLMNPFACYYCYAADGATLQAVVAEVTNTPWEERHAYVLRVPAAAGLLDTSFDKALHVSPFHPMTMRYRWRGNAPAERLAVHLENHVDGTRVFDATLSLQREPLDRTALNRLLLRFPMMTLRIAAAIYWQALRLLLKRAPLHSHPANDEPAKETTG
jgi:uncharacterized protein